MSNLIVQLPALIGVIIGALGSYLVGAATDRARWRRERNARWDTHRMQTYAAYGHAVKTVTVLATRVAAQRGLGEYVETLSIEQGLSQLAEANSTRAALWEQVLLLGDVDTISAARRWHESAWHLERFARGLETGSDAWASAMREANGARAMFYKAARGDLGVPGTPPATTWPRRPLQPSQIAQADQANTETQQI